MHPHQGSLAIKRPYVTCGLTGSPWGVSFAWWHSCDELRPPPPSFRVVLHGRTTRRLQQVAFASVNRASVRTRREKPPMRCAAPHVRSPWRRWPTRLDLPVRRRPATPHQDARGQSRSDDRLPSHQRMTYQRMRAPLRACRAQLLLALLDRCCGVCATLRHVASDPLGHVGELGVVIEESET